jgi:hypothetical protein
MGSILTFVPRKAVPRPANQPADTLASVVIFPGVRYERNLLIEAAGVCTSAGRVDEAPKKPKPSH